MGLRDLFRGQKEPKTDETKNEQPTTEQEPESQASEATETQAEVADSEATQPAATIQSPLVAKQRLADVARQYNDTREVLQDLLFGNQSTTQAKIETLNTQIADLQQTVDDTGKSISQIQDEMENNLQKATSELVAQQKDLNQKIKAGQDQAGALIMQVNEINQEIGTLNEKQQKLAQAEKDISAQFESTEDPADIVSLADQYRDDIAVNKKEREANAQLIVEVDAKREKVKQQLQSVRDGLTADQKSLSDVNDQVEDVQIKIASEDEERSKQLDSLTADLTKSQNELAKLKNEKDEQDEQLATINQDIQDWLGIKVPVKGLELDADSEIVLDMDNLSDDQFALMKLVVKLFMERGIKHIGLYSSQFTLNLNSQIAKWTNDLAVSNGTVSVHNPLYNLLHQGDLGAKYQLPDNAVSDEWNDTHTERTLVLPDDGWSLKIRYFDLGENISTIDAYQNDQLSETSFLSTEGRLASNRFYHDDGTKDRDEYYRQNGLGVLTIHYENDNLSSIELLNPVGMQVATFKSIDEFNQWWLQNDFNTNGVLVGPIENDAYRNFLKIAQKAPIALVTDAVLEDDAFNDWTDSLPEQQYLVANYDTERKLIDKLQKPINVSLIDPHNLPITIGVPSVERDE
ncbi:hypothetical protein [Secundilactobacillus folii]|uniref:Uncharacterized protein n=1 Tax=Secundilactobacillus folii TaxID=2678357 RepID=A0A7X2XV53_9LACO|nr:hypothetical protein [Secundilactobacillus folii]MTV82203.1 hypothetical protein [Secundilactobacillus folii]